PRPPPGSPRRRARARPQRRGARARRARSVCRDRGRERRDAARAPRRLRRARPRPARLRARRVRRRRPAARVRARRGARDPHGARPRGRRRPVRARPRGERRAPRPRPVARRPARGGRRASGGGRGGPALPRPVVRADRPTRRRSRRGVPPRPRGAVRLRRPPRGARARRRPHLRDEAGPAARAAGGGAPPCRRSGAGGGPGRDLLGSGGLGGRHRRARDARADAMRATAQRSGAELVLELAMVEPRLEPAIRELGFAPDGHRYVRRFPADSAHAGRAAARFPLVAAELVRQTARLSPAPWEDALAELIRRSDGVDWWLAGSAALAVRGLDVAPRDLDVIAGSAGAAALADALADVLVEPLAPGGRLGEWWTRAFLRARVEIVGDGLPQVGDPE